MLAPAPRRVPVLLWVRLGFGGIIAQAGWFGFALIPWIGVIALVHGRGKPHPPDDLPISWFFAITVFVGVPILAVAAVRAHRQLSLLRHGIETRGRLLGKREVANSETSYWHYTFEYKTVDGAVFTSATVTDSPEPRLEDDATEPMVYDPKRPEKATTLDHLPGYPAITETGELVVRDRGVVHVLVLPLLAIAGQIALYTLA